jgi:hypothetical protein
MAPVTVFQQFETSGLFATLRRPSFQQAAQLLKGEMDAGHGVWGVTQYAGGAGGLIFPVQDRAPEACIQLLLVKSSAAFGSEHSRDQRNRGPTHIAHEGISPTAKQGVATPQ